LPNSIPQGYNVFFDIIQEIQDEGIALPFRPTLNFIGTGVVATEDVPNNRINVDIPGNVQPHDLLDGSQNQDTVANAVTQGDLIVGNASPLWDVLAIGTSLQQLRVNAGGTDLEYFTPAPATSFYQTIQDEGGALAQQPTFNFIGTGVTAVDDPGNNRTNITIPGNVQPHALLDGVQNNDTVANAPTRGSLIFGNATPLWDELLLGGSGQFLKSDGTDVLWDNIVKADISDFAHNLLSLEHSDTVVNGATEGSIILGNSTPAWDELVIGANGTVLTSDGTTASWQTPSAGTVFYQTIQDEGVALPQQPTFNFIGPIVTAVDDPGNNRTNITITGGAGGATYLMAYHDDGALPPDVEFAPFWGDNMETNETKAQSFVAFAYTVKRVTAHVATNSSDNVTNFTMRDDGVDVPNTLLAIPSSTTGSFDSGAISESITANSLVDIKADRTGDTSFTDWNYFVECEK